MADLRPRVDPGVLRIDDGDAVLHELLLNSMLHDLAGHTQLGPAVDAHRFFRTDRRDRHYLVAARDEHG